MNKTLRKLLAVSLVAFGVFCFFKGLPSSVTRDAANGVMPGAVASIHSVRPAWPAGADVKTRAIQDIRVGQRVLAKNPEISSLERRTRRAEPDFGRWLQFSLEMPKSDGSTRHIEMLRFEEWLRNQIGFVIREIPDPSGERLGVSPPCTTATATLDLNPPSPKTENLQPKTELAPLSPLRPIFSDIAFATVAAEAEGVQLVGLTVDLDLPEMGACGTAVITGISTTPEIEQGDGQVVTATFRHPPSNTVLDVVFVDEGTNLDQHGLAAAETTVDPADVVVVQASQPETSSKPIGVTDNHLFWSEDRGEFIEIGRMDIGERVRTLFGETKILAQKLPRPGPPAEVYNLEVHEEHVYFVGDDGVLAHNAYGSHGDLIDNNIFTQIIKGDTDAIAFASRRSGSLHATDNIIGEALKHHSLEEVGQTLNRYSISRIATPSSRHIFAEMTSLNVSSMKHFNDVSQIVAARQNGLRLITADQTLFRRAYRSGYADIQFRVFDHARSVRIENYSKIRDFLSSQGVSSTHGYTGSTIGR